jgi:hypothetical protein
MQCPSVEFLKYIQIYQRIFRNVLNEAKRKESDMFWQLKIEAKLYGNLQIRNPEKHSKITISQLRKVII